MILSYKCKINIDKEQSEQLIKVLHFNNFICNIIAQKAFESQVFKQFDIHKFVYYSIRQEYNVKSQQLVKCIAKVADQFKIQKGTAPISKSLCMDYDNRNLNINLIDKTISFSPNDSDNNYKFKLNIDIHPRIDLDQKIQNSYKICYENKNFYLIIFQNKEEKTIITHPKSIGIDLGINTIATLSTGHIFGSKKLNFINKKYRAIRSKLQSRNTKSSKRKLIKLSRKLSNFTKNMNHVISKKIVSLAKAHNSNLVLEDLKYIRIKSTVTKAKPLIAKLNKWSFSQLRSFIEYKSSLAGVHLQIVKAHFTSQCCSKCGFTNKLNRQTQACFKCIQCGYTLNADLNASINLSRKFVYATVNSLKVSFNKTETTSFETLSRHEVFKAS